MGTAVITRRTGEKEYYSDGKQVSRSDYTKQVQKETQKKLDVQKRKTGKSSRAEIIGGEVKVITVSEAPIVARDSTGKGYTATDLLIEQNKALLQQQPKGSYKVTRADGTVVYRTSGRTATGQYVKDVYQRLQEQKQVETIRGRYKSIPKSAQKVTTDEGDVYRLFKKRAGQTIVTDYKPGGIKETKVLTQTFIGGSSQFIPKQEKKKDKPSFLLPPTPAVDFALSVKGEPKQLSPGYEARIKKLVEREENLARTKEKVFKTLRIKGKENAKFYNLFEVGKAVARAPFEIAGLPVYLGGRVSFVTESLFHKEGRKELFRGFKATPGAVREVFVHKDIATGQYQLTAQNIANIGLTTLAVKGVAKSPKNVGLKVYEKYAKTDIKGTIKGYQATTVFKSAGKLKGRPYKELTVFKGKSSTSTIQYQGKTFIIKRGPSGKGTYKIVKTKTKLKIDRKGPIPKKLRLEKEAVVLKKGTFKADGKPIEFKAEKGVTTQDIQFLDQRALSKTYINYLEQLKTRAKATAQIKSGSQQLKFDAQTKIKVKGDLSGTVTHQKTFIDKVDFTTPQTTLTRQFKKPIIKFADKPINPKDVVIAKVFKEGKAITGYEKGFITQPKHLLVGTKDAFVSGQFRITGGRGFGVSNPFKNIKTPKFPKPGKVPKIKTPKPIEPTVFKETGKISKSKIDTPVKSIYKSKPAPLSEQIALTEQVRAETVYNVPFQTKAPKVEFSPLNFQILDAPLGSVKPVPLIPTPIGKVSSQPPKTLNIFRPQIIEPAPISRIKTFQEVRPTTAFKVTSVIEQIQGKKPIADIKVGQRGKPSTTQKPKSIIEQVQSQIPIQKQVARQEQAFQNVFKQTPVTPTFQTPQPFKFQVPTIGGFPKFGLDKTPTQKGFDVFTRIKGVFKKANIKPLSKQDAINFGAYRVGTTSQATFKIGEANGEVQDVFRGRGVLKDFYKKDDLFIEKRGRRIKSIGELQEITFKGIQSRKKKNIFGGKK